MARYNKTRKSGTPKFRVPLLGIRIPYLLIWFAIVGGALYFFRDALTPLWNKVKSMLPSANGSISNMN